MYNLIENPCIRSCCHSLSLITLYFINCILQTEILNTIIVYNSIIYFISDLFTETKHKSVYIHHGISILGCYFGQDSLNMLVNTMFLHEFSNPCWAILRVCVEKERKDNYTKNLTILFLMTFVITRFFIWPIYYWYFAEIKFYTRPIVFSLNILNTYWLYRLIRGIRKIC